MRFRGKDAAVDWTGEILLNDFNGVKPVDNRRVECIKFGISRPA